MNNSTTIWFVYDGDCPLCKIAATALRIKKEYGTLHLINARDARDNALLNEINARGYNLDEGMVIFDGEQYYHGDTALTFMAKYAEPNGVFNLTTRALFWSDFIAKILYPGLRGIRNLLLRQRNICRINNLKREPTFKNIFGESWQHLPAVMHKHYANRPYTDDVTVAEGIMNFHCSGPIKFFSPLLKILGSIPPYNESNVPVTVHFNSNRHANTFGFTRTFHFKNQQPYVFNSRMQQTQGNHVVEIMRFGLSWKMQYLWQDPHIKLVHRGYALKLFGFFLPLPLTLLLGQVYAFETAVDDNCFDMSVSITHPLWGKIYEYQGRFIIKESP